MKQRSKILSVFNILIAVAMVTAIVIVTLSAIQIYRRTTTVRRLRMLAISSKSADEAFSDKYSDIEERTISSSEKVLRKAINKVIEEAKANSFKTLDEVKEILDAIPHEYTAIAADDSIYSLLFGQPVNGTEAYDSFVANSRLGRPCELKMVQFTINLDPIFYYIEYDGKKYHIVEDQRSDDYTDESGIIEGTSYFTRFEGYFENTGDITEYGYSTDDPLLRYKDILNYYDEKDNDTRAPSYWQFYVGTIEKDKLDDRVIVPNRPDEDFVKKYTGFADVHPSFKDENPLKDYDGDGTVDRVYREYYVTKYGAAVNIYLFLGNGNTIYLAQNAKGENFSTKMKDVTGDGNEDIVFTQYVKKNDPNWSDTRVFEYKNGNYILSEEK